MGENYSVTIWFTSDQHFDHANIIRHCKRPYPFVTQMNRSLIENFNAVVGKNDTTYHLGDFVWKHNWSVALSFFKKLNGKHKVLEGNHDKWLRKLRAGENPHAKIYEPHLNEKVQIIEPLKEIVIDGQRIVLSHYALATWCASGRGSWMLHGHSHGNYKPEFGRVMDVGVDPNNYFPVSFKQVREYMETRQSKAVDHHKERK